MSPEKVLENVSMSLVREFLKRKGLSVTYQTLDEEAPKTEDSITNRTELARYLHIERLLKRNKEASNPLRTILEVVAKYLIEVAPPDRGEEVSYNDQNKTQRPKSSKGCAPVYDSGLLVEDDLETELMIGRGMEDVMQVQNQLEVVPPSQPKPKQKRKHRRSFYQSSQQEDEQYKSVNVHGPSQLEAGDVDVYAQVNTTPNSASSEQTTPDSGAEAKEAAAKDGTEQDDVVGKIDEDVDEFPHDKDGCETATDDPDVLNQSNDEQQVTIPSPPHKLPNYLNESIKKSDMERSMELLRQRRLTQQRADNILAEPGEEIVAEAAVVGGEVSRPAVDREEGLQEGELEHEESYSPRIVCDTPEPVASPQPEPPTQEVAVNKEQEQTINKQPVSYMSVKEVISSAKSIDIHTASALKKLVLGSTSQLFPKEWMCQGVSFCDLPALLYGIIQHRPGPCGLLSVLQGYFMVELLFSHQLTKDIPSHRKLSPHPDHRCALLASAISKLLWKCGEEKRAVLALPSDNTIFSGGGRFKPDGITETLLINIIDNYEDTLNFTRRFLPYFADDDNGGVILILYSVVLSRGIDQVRDDMDAADTSLIDDSGFCSQELVNLLLCGKAASNIFNDSVELTQGLGKTVILKGIPTRCELGFLSLLEHTNRRYQVGTFLKTPKYPVWVCLIEGHYSLVFCLNKELVSDWKAERRFDLMYYDPLRRIEESIRLSIDTTSRFFQPPEDDEGVPPLELCLRTKWKDAQINWNGSEPIAAQAKPDPLDALLSMM